MRKKLLLADDSITIQKVVELTFPSDEFEVVTAGNGRIAVDKAMTFLPDVVLCDVIMPQLDGYQVCEALRASEQLNVPILLLNGAFEPYDAERAKSVGALGNVSKPFDPPALVARVKEILAERQTSSFPRPTQPMSLDAIAEAAEAAAPAEAAATVPHDLAHEYSYDETETHPVSTVEVPMDVREMAARSLSLDAPVFAPAEPDVLTTEAEPSDFSETLHGPLDEELPAAAPQEVEAIQEIETTDEIEPVAATGEIEAPAAAAPAEVASEAFEFEPDTARSGEFQMPPTLPPAPAPKAPEPADEFAGEREFDPAELESVTAEPEVINTSPDAISAPEELPVAKTEPTPEVMAVPEPVAPPAPPPPVFLTPPVVAAPAPPPPPPVAVAPGAAGAFDNLVGTAPQAPAPAPAAPLPSAEVAVPVDMVQQIAQRVISQVSERVIREIAWDVIPGLAEKLIKAEIERIKARAESERD